MLQRLSNAVPLCKVVARPSFCSERPSNRSNQTQYHLVEKWTIPRQRHVIKRSLTYSFTSIKLLFFNLLQACPVMLNVCFARILHTCLPLHLVAMESNKEPSSKRSITPLGTSENWLHVISQGFLCLLLHNFWSSCLPGPSAHLSILAEKWEPQLSHCRHIRASMSVPMSMLKHFTAVQAIKLQFPSSWCRMEEHFFSDGTIFLDEDAFVQNC